MSKEEQSEMIKTLQELGIKGEVRSATEDTDHVKAGELSYRITDPKSVEALEKNIFQPETKEKVEPEKAKEEPTPENGKEDEKKNVKRGYWKNETREDGTKITVGYNSKNVKTSETERREDGTKLCTRFDENGKVSSIEESCLDGSRTVIRYTKDGSEKTLHRSSDGTETTTIMAADGKTKVSEKIKSKDGTSVKRKFDSNGKVISEKKFDKKGKEIKPVNPVQKKMVGDHTAKQALKESTPNVVKQAANAFKNNKAA